MEKRSGGKERELWGGRKGLVGLLWGGRKVGGEMRVAGNLGGKV